MKTQIQTILLTAFLGVVFPAELRAQGTAFTYQGRLADGANPASGIYDLRFAIYDSTNHPGTLIAGPVTNSAVAVTNGLFTTTVDFGNVFTGGSNWLEIAVSTNGANSFSTLAPRQQITPTPYAITAENLNGTVAGGGLSGSYGNAVTLNNVANQFTGTFTGNGGGLTNVDAAKLGGLAATRFWQLAGNNVALGDFFGSTNNQPVEIWANNQRVMQFAYAVNPVDGTSPNLIGGFGGNVVAGSVVGAAILGGGSANGIFGGTNSVNADFGTVLGGYRNTVSGTYSIAGGSGSSASGSQATALGGANASGDFSTALGNSGATGKFSTAAGTSSANARAATAMGSSTASGTNSTAMGASTASGYGATAMGAFASATADYATATGQSTASGANSSAFGNATASGQGSAAVGLANVASGAFSTITGGSNNLATADYSLISGGKLNYTAVLAPYSTIGGGKFNTANGTASSVGGGILNLARGWADTVAGGQQNEAGGINQGGDPIDSISTYVIFGACTVGGGYGNRATNFAATVSGGTGNKASGYSATVCGGYDNWANNSEAVVCGGFNNYAGGIESFAAGQYAQALHDRTFLWSAYPANAPTFLSDQFQVAATNGIGLNCGAQRLDGGGQYWMNIGYINGGRMIDTSVGAYLSLGGAWVPNSDRARKENFAPVDPRQVLDRVAKLPIKTWNYTNEPSYMQHLGPMAQDFHAVFGLNGNDDKHIADVDEGGVALAAIQGLNEKVEVRSQKSEIGIQKLEAENTELKQRLAALEKIVFQKQSN